jgi:predicted ABC-type ATPase
LVAGPNGSGKTTLVRQGVLSRVLKLPATSLNADDLARELAGGQLPTPAQSLHAAQLCDDRLDAEIVAGRSVMVETVLSSDKLMRRVEAAQSAGYRFSLVYITLHDGALNVARVAQRHAGGGHDVPPERVLDRRTRSHAHFAWFARRADLLLVFDNTSVPVYAAGRADGVWYIADVDRLPPDLAKTIRQLAQQPSTRESAPASI